jgi:hypothetical protein
VFTDIVACLLAESPKAVCCLEGFDGFVASASAPTATGWSDQLSGQESHLLKIRAFSRRTATNVYCRRIHPGRLQTAVSPSQHASSCPAYGQTTHRGNSPRVSIATHAPFLSIWYGKAHRVAELALGRDKRTRFASRAGRTRWVNPVELPGGSRLPGERGKPHPTHKFAFADRTRTIDRP